MKDRSTYERAQIKIANDDGFYTGLPELTKRKKGNRISCFTKEEKLQRKLAQEKIKAERAQYLMQKIEDEIKEVSSLNHSRASIRDRNLDMLA